MYCKDDILRTLESLWESLDLSVFCSSTSFEPFSYGLGLELLVFFFVCFFLFLIIIIFFFFIFKDIRFS